MDLPNLSSSDVLTFLAVKRCGSMTGAAREMKVTPSQVCKSVARLERQLHVKLLARTPHGMVVSEAGQRMMPHLEDIVSRLRFLRAARGDGMPELTVATPSSLTDFFLPVIAECLRSCRIRGLVMSAAEIRMHAGERLFDLALGVDPAPLPEQWVSVRIGDVRHALFAPRSLAAKLGPLPVKVDVLRQVPLVTPIATSNGQFVTADDECPLSQADRRVGHQAQTISAGLELAARTEQAIFGPALAARDHVESGRLVEIPVLGWNVREPIYLACDADRVLAKTQRDLVAALQHAMGSDADAERYRPPLQALAPVR